MYKTVMAFLFCLLGCLANAQTKPALDWKTINLEWEFIKQQVGAPNSLPMPTIIVSNNIPEKARMMFQYPTKEDPSVPVMIIVNPTTLESYGHEMISWGIGHELTHYAFIMRENHWDYTLKEFTQTQRHHCNTEFMRITRDVAELIYGVYHDQRSLYQAWDQVQRSCVDQPHQ